MGIVRVLISLIELPTAVAMLYHGLSDSSDNPPSCCKNHLCDELNDTTGLGDLLLSELGEPAGTDDDWDLWETALAENLGVAEWEEVDNWEGIGVLVLEVLVALLSWDEGPELWLC